MSYLHYLCVFGSSLPPVVCTRTHVLLCLFGSSLPPVVCMRTHVLLCLFGSSLPPVVCMRTHVLFPVVLEGMFGSCLPPVVYSMRAHVLFTLFVFVRFLFTSSCLQYEGICLIDSCLIVFSSLPPVVCWRVLFVFVRFLFTSSCLYEDSCLIYIICVCSVPVYLQLFV